MANIATISFHDQSIIAIEHEGKHFVALRPIVENIGLDWAAQYSRIKRNPIMGKGVVMMTTPSAGGDQKTLALPLSMLNGWLFGVEVSRVREEIRPKLIRYQTECFDVLYRHFMPPQRTHNPALDYDRISPAQAQDLKEIVAAIVKEGIQGYGETWARLQKKFRVNSYLELPATRHLEARAYLLGKLPKPVAGNVVDEAPTPAPTMFGRQWLVSTDMNGKETVRPVAPDQFVNSFREIARGIAVGDMELSTAELIDLASACNQRLVRRLGNPALVLAV